jgi:hypothetical protein
MVEIIMFRPHSSCCPAVAAQLLLLFPRIRMRHQPMLLQLSRPRRLKTAQAAGEAHADVGAQLVPTQHARRDRPMVTRVAGEALLPRGLYIGKYQPELRFRIRDPGSGAFLTPGSGIRNRFFPDPGSQTHIFESLVTIFR